MLASDLPAFIPEAFAKNATAGTYIRSIPTTTGTPGQASWDKGFPPECFVDPNAGGFPPDGKDFNGLLNNLSAWAQWLSASGPVAYNGSFQTAISGYWNGAVVGSIAYPGLWWQSTADNNTTNPDTGGAGWVVFKRARLTTNTTWNVATTGNDTTGNGSGGSPWATITRAVYILTNYYDGAGYAGTISVADGTYAATVSVAQPFTGFSSVSIIGNNGTPDNVVLSGGVQATGSGSAITLSGMKITASGDGILALSGGFISFSNVDFGTCGGSHIHIGVGEVFATGSYFISGSAFAHIQIQYGFMSAINLTMTFIGTQNFSGAFAVMNYAGVLAVYNDTFVGSATGARFAIVNAGGIDTALAGVNYLPGSVAGTVVSPGWYN